MHAPKLVFMHNSLNSLDYKGYVSGSPIAFSSRPIARKEKQFDCAKIIVNGDKEYIV